MIVDAIKNATKAPPESMTSPKTLKCLKFVKEMKEAGALKPQEFIGISQVEGGLEQLRPSSLSDRS